MTAASAGSAAAVAAMIQAVKASGVIVSVDPQNFMALIDQHPDPLIVTAKGGFFTAKFQYLLSYRGFAFFTTSKEALMFPSRCQFVMARKIWVPG